MVSLQTVQQSNARISSLPKGLVALFIGATSGIGQSALQQFAHHVSSPHIYTVARPSAVTSHDNLLATLRQSSPAGTYNLITADISLISEIDKVVNNITQKETKLDILFMSAGFMAFEGRKDTIEGLDPSMTTRYYSRLRAVQQLLPLLNNSPSPRIVSVLGGGIEAPLNELDLDLRDPANWSFMKAAFQSATMGTLALERLAQKNSRLSIVHWFPGPVATPGLAKAKEYGMVPPNQMKLEESGARAVFVATSDRYSTNGEGLVPVPDGLGAVKKSGGGIYLVNPLGEGTDNERLLAELRQRKVDEKVWSFTQKVFADCEAQAQNSKDEL
jgi:NAD(P)-dependent dehydrogenase (short-subunit alcohol dehydrogenase family)